MLVHGWTLARLTMGIRMPRASGCAPQEILIWTLWNFFLNFRLPRLLTSWGEAWWNADMLGVGYALGAMRQAPRHAVSLGPEGTAREET